MAFIFTEGEGPYTVNVGITNASTKGGLPWGAELHMEIAIVGPRTYVSQVRVAQYSVGERKTFPFAFSIPMGDVGNGSIQVVVSAPTGVVLNQANASFIIEEAPIDYGADVVIS